MRKDYRIINGKPIAVVYRKKGETDIELCPFCFKKHSHGLASGHRITHCSQEYQGKERYGNDDVILNQSDGYIIIDY